MQSNYFTAIQVITEMRKSNAKQNGSSVFNMKTIQKELYKDLKT